MIVFKSSDDEADLLLNTYNFLDSVLTIKTFCQTILNIASPSACRQLYRYQQHHHDLHHHYHILNAEDLVVFSFPSQLLAIRFFHWLFPSSLHLSDRYRNDSNVYQNVTRVFSLHSTFKTSLYSYTSLSSGDFIFFSCVRSFQFKEKLQNFI